MVVDTRPSVLESVTNAMIISKIVLVKYRIFGIKPNCNGSNKSLQNDNLNEFSYRKASNFM